jgi:HAD superfamily hydrolase (TIGR01509 family)
MRLEALIFDFDGTMLDTETPEFLSWQQIYSDHGATLELSDWERGIGTWGAFDPWVDLETKIGRTLNKEPIALAHHARVKAAITASKLLPGVLNLLIGARDAGLKLAIASSSNREWVEGWARRLGVLDFFAATATQDDVLRVKPDPALYRLACEQLGVQPQHALALEDSANGAMSALAAGLHCAVIPNPVTRSLEFPRGVVRLETLENVRLEDLRVLMSE